MIIIIIYEFNFKWYTPKKISGFYKVIQNLLTRGISFVSKTFNFYITFRLKIKACYLQETKDTKNMVASFISKLQKTPVKKAGELSSTRSKSPQKLI